MASEKGHSMSDNTSNSNEEETTDNKKSLSTPVLVAIISLITAIVGGVITGIFMLINTRAQINLPAKLTQTAESVVLTLTAQSVPGEIPTLLPTDTLIPPPTYTETPEIVAEATLSHTPEPKVDFLVPTSDDVYNLPLLFYDYVISGKPVTRTYKKTIQSNETFLWKYFWCAKYDGTLQENLMEINFEFMVDDIPVPEDYFLKYKSTGGFGEAQTDWKCQLWATIVTNWSQGETVKLSVFYTIQRPVSDGDNIYQPGDYRHDIIVSVE